MVSIFNKFFKRKLGLPNTQSLVVKFNYYYSFEYLPKCIKLYNEGNVNIMSTVDVISLKLKHPEFSNLLPKLEFGLSENNSKPDIKVLAIAVPNTKSISEVEIAYIVFNEKTHLALYYTFEHSVNGEYAICQPKEDGRHFFLDTVKTPEDFTKHALEDAIRILNSEVEAVKNSEVTDNFCIENDENKLSDILTAINWEIERYAETIFFPHNERAKAECYIYFASLMPNYIPTSDLAKAIYKCMNELDSLGLDIIENKIGLYREYYKNLIEKPFIERRWTLVNFAKEFGRMKVTNEITNTHTGEKFKSGAFINDKGEVTLAGFSNFHESQQDADFISAHKHEIGVVKMRSGIYKLYFIEGEKRDEYTFLRGVTQSIFLYPLEKELNFTKESYPFEWEGITNNKELLISNMSVTYEIREMLKGGCDILEISKYFPQN